MKRKSTLKKIIKRTKRVNDKKAKLKLFNEVIKAQEEAKKASKKAQKLYEKYVSLY